MPKKLTKEEFVHRSVLVHKDKYDYSKVAYVNSSTKVCIVCRKHGAFWITPSHHMNGVGCAKCHHEELGNLRKLTQEEFISRSQLVHGHKYRYDKVVYINSATKVVITCPKHGDFEQTPANHLRGQGCWYCGNERNAKRNHETPRFYQRKIHYGVGISDYNASLSDDKAYIAWMNMLKRCYDESVRHKFPTYKDCTVCEEWLSFSVFREWFYDNYIEGYSLDKDILVKGNKVYSPETCCFVPQEINAMLTKAESIRGELPLGVAKSGKRFWSRISIDKKLISLGSYDTPEEAFYVYKKAKEQHICDVAKEYFEKNLISKEVYKALLNYKIEITD